MEQKEIKNGMTQGEWEVSEMDSSNIRSCNDNHIVECYGDVSKSTEDEANALAIVSAINATYLNDIDPTKVKPMFEALETILSSIDGGGNVVTFQDHDILALRNLTTKL